MADSMAGGTRYWSDSSNFRQAQQTERVYDTIEHVRINDTMFSGKIFRSITETHTRNELGNAEFGVDISTTVHGSGDLRKLLRELNLMVMVIVVTHTGGTQKVYRDVAIVETTMDVQVGFTARLISVDMATVLPSEPEEKERPEPVQIIIDDQLIPMEHCSAVWEKSRIGPTYRITVEVSYEYAELDGFTVELPSTIKIRYPDVELTFLGEDRLHLDPKKDKGRRYRYGFRAKLINERKVKTQKPELF